MAAKPRRRFVPAPEPDAEPHCRLTKESAERREVTPDALFAEALAETTLENGAEYRFQAKPGMWERVSLFVDEEKECCPFFDYEQIEEGDEVVLRILHAKEAQA